MRWPESFAIISFCDPGELLLLFTYANSTPFGWGTLSQIFLTDYGCSMSRSHATITQCTNYVGVLEEDYAAWVAVVCHFPCKTALHKGKKRVWHPGCMRFRG